MRSEIAKTWCRIYQVATKMTEQSWCSTRWRHLCSHCRRWESSREQRRSRRPLSFSQQARRQTRHITAVLQKLKDMHCSTTAITHQQFLDICREVTHGSRAEYLAKVCYTEGHVLKYGSRVYTSSRRLSAALAKQLLDQPAHIETLRTAALAELRPLKLRKTELDHIAYVTVQRWFRAGWLALIFQMFLLMRLTYVELSWDYIEPIGYTINMILTILGCAYSARTYEVPALTFMRSRLLKSYQGKLYRADVLDFQRYEHLCRRVAFYEKWLSEFALTKDRSSIKGGS